MSRWEIPKLALRNDLARKKPYRNCFSGTVSVFLVGLKVM